ncbi:MAG: YHS domain-containing protein [Chloroflexota bacterium]
MIEDMVCNTPLPRPTEMWVSRYHGQIYYFCSLACRERFELEPEDYFPAPRLRPLLPPAIPALR